MNRFVGEARRGDNDELGRSKFYVWQSSVHADGCHGALHGLVADEGGLPLWHRRAPLLHGRKLRHVPGAYEQGELTVIVCILRSNGCPCYSRRQHIWYGSASKRRMRGCKYGHWT